MRIHDEIDLEFKELCSKGTINVTVCDSKKKMEIKEQKTKN